jgi:spore germination cell wall hydrolase CwlJ-like protein
MSNPSMRAYSYEEILTAICIWREARGESREAMVAVAWTIRNRAEHPKWWGTEYVSVVTRKWQFSSMSAPGDVQLIKYPQITDPVFPVCLEVASTVMDDQEPDPAGGSTSYYDDSIAPPPWATPERFACKIGRLNFYRVDVDA